MGRPEKARIYMLETPAAKFQRQKGLKTTSQWDLGEYVSRMFGNNSLALGIGYE